MSPDPESARGSGQPSPTPDSIQLQRPWFFLDRLGVTQAIGGLILGLIALFSSYDHISLAGHSIALQQQWGILCIVASLATVLVDAELASRSRLRAAYEREVDRAGAAEARERQAENAERQNKALDLLRRSAVLSARVQLDPTAANRARLRTFLTLMGAPRVEEG